MKMKKNSFKQQFIELFTICAFAGMIILATNFSAQAQKNDNEAAANASNVESGYASILIGLLRTQYAKVSVVNQSNKSIPVKFILIDDKGKVLILCDEIVQSGKSVSETFQHSGGVNRLEFYAQIRTADNKDLKNLVPSMQIIDTETDRTDHFIGGSDFFAFRPIFNPPLVELPGIQ